MQKKPNKSRFSTKLGTLMRKYREQLGYTQTEVCHDIGITNVWLSTLERGEAPCTAGSIQPFLDYYVSNGVDVDRLLVAEYFLESSLTMKKSDYSDKQKILLFLVGCIALEDEVVDKLTRKVMKAIKDTDESRNSIYLLKKSEEIDA